MKFEFHLLPHTDLTPKQSEEEKEWKPFYQGSSPILSYLSENALYLLSFLIPTVFMLILLAGHGFAPFGTKSYFILNGTEHISIINTIIEQLHSGNFSLLAPEGNIGGEYFSTILMYLCSPLRLLLTLFPQSTSIPLLTIFVVLLIGLSGFSMSLYLTKRLGGIPFSKYNLSTLLFSMGYALSSYMLVQYNDFIYLECAALFPILMLTYEHLLYQNRKTPFILLLAVLLFCNYFISSVTAGFLLLHLLTRQKGDFHQAMQCLRRYVVSVICAALLSAVTVIPGFYTLYRSQIITSIWPDFALITDWFSLFSRFLPSNYGSYSATEAYGSNFYCGLFILISFFFYLLDKKISRNQRFRNFIFISMLLIISNVTPLQYMARLFTDNGALFNCFGFIVIFFILSVCSESFYHLKNLSLWKGSLALLVPFALFMLATLYAADYRNRDSILYTLVFFVIYGMLWIFYRISSISRKTFYGLLFLFAMAEICSNAVKNTDYLVYDAQNISDYQVASTSCSPGSFSPFTMTELSDNFAPADCYFVKGSYTPANAYSSTIFEEQNEIAASLGASEDIFCTAELDIDYRISPNITCRKTSSNIFTLMVLPDTSNSKAPYNRIILEITPKQSGDLYLYANELVHIGPVTAGESFTHSMTFATSTVYQNYWVHGAYLDTDILSALKTDLEYDYTSLQKKGLTGWELKADAPTDGTLLLDLPRSEFISYKIDGASVPPVYSSDQITALALSAGEHVIQIRINYTPFYLGCVVFMVALACAFLHRKKFRKLRVMGELLKEKLNTACYHLETFCLKHSTALYSFLLPLLFLLTACILSDVSPFGLNAFFKNDGDFLTIPTFYQEREQLLSGSFFYSWTSGGGTNIFYSMPTMFLNYWLCLIPEKFLSQWITIIEIIKIALCGFTCYLYLTRRRIGQRIHRKDYRILIFTTAYSLSSYMLNMRCYFSWVDLLMLFPLILISLDKLMLDKKKSLYIFLLAFGILNNYYIALFICVYLVFTFFTYHFDSVKDFIRKGFRFAFSSIVAAGMCFFVLFATYMGLQVSPYSANDSLLPTFQFYQSFWDSLKQTFVLSEPIVVTELDGAINLYCGVFCLLLAGLYLLLAKRSKNKYLKLGFMLFILFSSNNQVLSYIWNGFHYQSKVPNRYSFLLIFLLIDVSCESLYRLKKCSTRKLVTIFAGLLAFVTVTHLLASQKPAIYSTVATLLLVCAFSLLLYLSVIKKGRQLVCKRIFVGLALAELLVSTCFVFLSSPFSLNHDIAHNRSETARLKELYLNDSLIDRVSYIGSIRYNENMTNHVNSVNRFNSFLTTYQTSWNALLGGSTSSNTMINRDNLNPFSNAITNTRYMVLDEFTTSNTMDLEHYTPTAWYNNATILENSHALPLGFYAPFETYVYTVENEDAASYANSFAAAFIPDNKIFTDITPISKAESEDAKEGNYYTCRTDTDNTEYHDIHFTPEKDGEYYYLYQEFSYLGYLEAGQECTFTMEATEDFSGFVCMYHPEAFEAFYNEASKYPLEIHSYSDTTLDGTITLPQDGCVSFSIPYEQGWKAYVDGVETPLATSTNGTLFLTATEGTHTIHLVFEPVGLTTGVTVSLIFAGIYLLVIISELLLPKYQKKKIITEVAEQKE